MLAAGPVAARLVSFPSSVVHTLPVVLRRVDTRLEWVRVPAGKQRVFLENPEKNLKRTVTLTIKPDQTLAVRVRLEDGKVERR